MDKFVFCRNADGSWRKLESSEELLKIRLIPGIRDIEFSDGCRAVALDLDDVKKFLKASSFDRLSRFSEIIGESLSRSVIRNASAYLDTLNQRIRQLKTEREDVRTVTYEEFQNASDFLEENRGCADDTEKLIYDFEMLLESEKRLNDAVADYRNAEARYRQLQESQRASKEDRRILDMYDRLVKGCQIEYSKMKNSQNILERLQQEYSELKNHREQLITERNEIRSIQTVAEKTADEFMSSREKRESAIAAAQRLDGVIAVQRQRYDSIVDEVKEKKSELAAAEERIIALRNRASAMEKDLNSLSSYIEQHSELDRCCLELDKVVDSMTRFIETDARIRNATKELENLGRQHEDRKKELADAMERMNAASRAADDSDYAMENITSAKNSADENPADLKITVLGRNIDFLNSLQPDIDKCTGLFAEYGDVKNELEEFRRMSGELSVASNQAREKIKSLESEKENLLRVKETLDGIGRLDSLRCHLSDGEQCPLCGSVVSDLNSFIKDVADNRAKISDDYERVIRELDELKSVIGRNEEEFARLSGVLPEKEKICEQMSQTLNFICQDLNEKTSERNLAVHWHNGDGVFTSQSISNAVVQIKAMVENYSKEFNELLHLKDRNDRTFRDYIVLKNTVVQSKENVSQCRRVVDECEDACRRIEEEIKNLKSDLETYENDAAELNSTLTAYMGDKWDELCNNFIRDSLSISQKEAAIVDWKNECLLYISRKDEYEKMTAAHSNLLTEENVARNTLDGSRASLENAVEEKTRAADELKELEFSRSRTLDDTVEHALEVLTADADSTNQKLKNASLEFERISRDITVAEQTLKQLQTKIDDCREDISESQSGIRHFVEGSSDFSMDMVDELMAHDNSFYSELRVSADRIDDELEASEIAFESASAAMRLYREEYGMRLRNIPNVSPDDVTDGILHHEWIEKQRRERLKLADEIRSSEDVVRKYREEAELYEQCQSRLEESVDLHELLCGDPEDPNEEYENGFSRLSKNVTVKMLADAADKYLCRISEQYRFKTVKESTSVRSLNLEVVDEYHSGSMVNLQNAGSSLLFQIALSAGLGILEVAGLRPMLEFVVISDGLKGSDQETADLISGALKTVADPEDLLSLMFVSSDRAVAEKMENPV